MGDGDESDGFTPHGSLDIFRGARPLPFGCIRADERDMGSPQLASGNSNARAAARISGPSEDREESRGPGPPTCGEASDVSRSSVAGLALCVVRSLSTD